MKYDYTAAMVEDILDWMQENAQSIADNVNTSDRIALANYLTAALAKVDQTGEGSGSFTFSKETAEEYVVSNLELVAQAYKGLPDPDGALDLCADIIADRWETIDVNVRRYYMPLAIWRAVEIATACKYYFTCGDPDNCARCKELQKICKEAKEEQI